MAGPKLDRSRIFAGAPLKVIQPKDLKYVREGRFCGTCRHWLDRERGQRALREDGFWDRAFRSHEDGTDWQPYHFGDPSQYSICDLRGAAAHLHSSCGRWSKKLTWRRFFAGKAGVRE